MAALILVPALLLAGGFCAWIYLRREFPVPGRTWLLAARLTALAAVGALLWNPLLPTPAGRAGPERYAILDASASMAALTAEGVPVWDSAVARARAHARDGARILAAGRSLRAVHPDSLDRIEPSGASSLMAEAVAVAAEAGAREAVLVTDRRLRDPVATAAAARRLGVGLAVDSLVGAGGNLGVARLALPASARGGEAVEGRIEIEGGAGAGADSVRIAIFVDGERSLGLALPAPAPGRASGADFVLPGGLAAGPRRVSARIEGSDAFAPDDERAAIVDVDPEEAGVVLVSFAPDWEPRFLLPVLDQVTGLPVLGLVRTGPDRYRPMESPDAPGREAVDSAGLARLLRRAEMVVAMGVDAAAAGIVADAAARPRRLLVFPLDAAGAALGGVAAGSALSGEWYLAEPGPSPIAGELQRFAGAGLPPLADVLPLLADDAPGEALGLRLRGAGEPRPALLLAASDGRRTGVVLARGFWRWAFRGGEPRDSYRRLWAAVGGWMMADEPLAGGAGVRPARRAAARGNPVQWLGRGREGWQLALAVTDSTGAAVLDSALSVPPDGAFATPPLPVGAYEYVAAAAAPPAPADGPPAAAPPLADTTVGAFVVEAFTDEMLLLPVDPATLAARPPPTDASPGGARPLRSFPALYLLVLAALCAEWVLRRRAGLR